MQNDFNWEFYIQYDDLKKAGINTEKKAYQHWISFGKKEGRICNNNNNTNSNINSLTGLLTCQTHLDSDISKNICANILHLPIVYHRKLWEYVYILHMLKLSDCYGKSGIGFGCGQEILVPALAELNCKIVATDQNFQDAVEQGWVQSGQHTDSGLESFKKYIPTVCDNETLVNNVCTDICDMNNIDIKFYNKFDFCWSCCALEHLGGLEEGLNFVINSLNCIKIGGFAVHTTEFNIDSLKPNYNGDTFISKHCVLYRKQDIEFLKNKIENLGHMFYPIDYSIGNQVIDNHIDFPPYLNFSVGYHNTQHHLKLKVDKYTTTCIGFIIRKNK